MPVPDHGTPAEEVDAILARLEGEHGLGGADDDGDDDDGSPAEEDADEPQRATDDGEADGGEPVAEAPAETPVDRAELTAALAVLARAGVPAGMLAGASNEQKLAWAAAYKPIQAQHDNAYRELGELKRKLAGSDEEAESKGVGGSPSAEPVVNPAVNLSTYLPAINEELGEDTAKALMAPLEGVLKYVEQRLESMQGGLRGLYVSDARRELAGAYPQLQDNEVFSQVEDLAEALVGTGKYDSMRGLFEAATKVVLADTIASGKAAARQAEVTQRTQGQVLPPDPAHEEPRKAMTPGDIEDAAIEALERGLDPREVRRKLQL